MVPIFNLIKSQTFIKWRCWRNGKEMDRRGEKGACLETGERYGWKMARSLSKRPKEALHKKPWGNIWGRITGFLHPWKMKIFEKICFILYALKVLEFGKNIEKSMNLILPNFCICINSYHYGRLSQHWSSEWKFKRTFWKLCMSSFVISEFYWRNRIWVPLKS